MYIELSQKALKVCSANYKDNCGGCPLRPLCVNEKVQNTEEKLNAHTLRINEFAEGVVI